MKFTETPLPGAFVINLEKRGDDRGFFARFFCEREYQQHGLNHRIVQINTSLSKDRGTLRGMHYQLAPKSEDKVVRCIRGALLDVIIDLRPDSPAFKRHFKIELTAENRSMLYVPKGFAHGFMTLAEALRRFISPRSFTPRNASAAFAGTTRSWALNGPWPPSSSRTKTEPRPTSNRRHTSTETCALL